MMNRVSHVSYVDAHYTYAKNIDELKLPVQEAYGFAERNAHAIVIFFIKENGVDTKETIEKNKEIIKGIVIPDTALVSVASAYGVGELKHIPIDSLVAIVWRDVRYVANVPMYECTEMSTEGVLIKMGDGHIILKDPKTVRIYPSPQVKHPAGEDPTYLTIPLSFITDCKVIEEKRAGI